MPDTTHEAPERMWIDPDILPSEWHKQYYCDVEYVRADLVQAAEQRGYANAMEAERKLHEDRIDELEAKLSRCEARLGKAVEALEGWLELASHCSIEEGVCCCGDSMENHSEPMSCGHVPLDHGAYIARHLEETTRTTLAELKGQDDE